MAGYIYIGERGTGYAIVTYWQSVETTSGTITPPAGAAIKQDSFQDLEDAVASTINSGLPTFNAAVSSSGDRVVVTMDLAGNFTLSPAPVGYPVAIVYRVIVRDTDINYNDPYLIVEDIERPGSADAVTDALSVGGGADVYKTKSGDVLHFRSLTAGTGIAVTEQTNEVQISNTKDTAEKVSNIFTCDSSAAVYDLVTPSEATSGKVNGLTSNVYDNLCIGIIVNKPTSTTCEVLISGKVTGLNGFTTGLPVFVGTDGNLTTTKPTTGHIQTLGMAISNDSVFILPQLSKVIQSA